MDLAFGILMRWVEIIQKRIFTLTFTFDGT